MSRTLLVLASAASLALVAAPAQSAGILTNHGAQTCGQWLSAAADKGASRGWVLGYLDAQTKFIDADRGRKGLPASQAMKGLDDATIFGLVDRYCRGKPQQTLGAAVASLSAQLIASEPLVIRSSAR